MRIFIAVRVTDEIMHNAEKIQESLSVPELKVKWVESYNLHVTLKFIGEVDVKTRMMIENILQGVLTKAKPFDLEFKGFGVFPNLQSPRVVWGGIGKGENDLKDLSEKLNDTLAMLDVRSEQWNFTGHVTLGRIKGRLGTEGLFHVLRELLEESLGTMRVASIDLMESKLSSSGPEYVVLQNIPLTV